MASETSPQTRDVHVCPYCRAIINPSPLFTWWWHLGGRNAEQAPSCCAAGEYQKQQMKARRSSGPIPVAGVDTPPGPQATSPRIAF